MYIFSYMLIKLLGFYFLYKNLELLIHILRCRFFVTNKILVKYIKLRKFKNKSYNYVNSRSSQTAYFVVETVLKWGRLQCTTVQWYKHVIQFNVLKRLSSPLTAFVQFRYYLFVSGNLQPDLARSSLYHYHIFRLTLSDNPILVFNEVLTI